MISSLKRSIIREMASTEMTIECLCHKEVNLRVVGGQYQDTYVGDCDCGRIWSLEEKSGEIDELLEIKDRNLS